MNAGFLFCTLPRKSISFSPSSFYVFFSLPPFPYLTILFRTHRATTDPARAFGRPTSPTPSLTSPPSAFSQQTANLFIHLSFFFSLSLSIAFVVNAGEKRISKRDMRSRGDEVLLTLSVRSADTCVGTRDEGGGCAHVPGGFRRLRILSRGSGSSTRFALCMTYETQVSYGRGPVLVFSVYFLPLSF